MKAKLLALFVALLMFGCLEDVQNQIQGTADLPMLIPCEACQQETSKSGESCPNCNHPTKDSIAAYRSKLEIEKENRKLEAQQEAEKRRLERLKAQQEKEFAEGRRKRQMEQEERLAPLIAEQQIRLKDHQREHEEQDRLEAKQSKLNSLNESGKFMMGKRAKSAGLFVRNGIIVLNVKVFDEVKREIREMESPFTSAAVDKKMGKYIKALELAGASYKESISEVNPRIMIRKYDNLVFLLEEAEDILYPSATIILAGAAPIQENTRIRGIKVDLGDQAP